MKKVKIKFQMMIDVGGEVHANNNGEWYFECGKVIVCEELMFSYLIYLK